MARAEGSANGPDGTPRSGGAGLKKREREIIDAAAEIFYRKGYSETSVQDVADAVGILKGSLYYYIDSKEDLLFQMLLEVHEDAKSVVDETAAMELPPLDRLRFYIQRHVEYNARNLAKIAVYYHDFGLLTPERKKAIVGQRHFYETFVQNLITEAQERGEVDDSVNPLLISYAIFGVANWLYTWYDVNGPASPEYLGRLYAELIVNGITAAEMPKPPGAAGTAATLGQVNDRYPLCASPIRVGPAEFRNRLTRTAHGTGYGVHGKVTERLIAYHEARARNGGVGSLFLETCGVHWTSRGPLWALDDGIIEGWSELAERLHRDDTKVLAQLWHGGAQAPPPDGSAAWAASAIPEPINGRISQAMTKSMIDEMVSCFGDAARRAKEAGLDGVEIHGAHTYLVCSFLSPLTNLRADEYGGPFENRLRFAREVLTAVRAAAGPELIVGIRLSATEGVEGGIEPDEAARIRQALEDDGLIDYVNVSMGGYFAFPMMIGAMHEPHGYELATSEPVTRSARIPSIVTGRILTLADAEGVLASGVADIVSMVRALIADPELVGKSFAGREQDVRPCIGCNEACVGRRFAVGAALGETACTVNPDAGFEYQQPPPERVAEPETVLVVGCGPAGLEAARTAALRGHRVSIHDQADRPGGMVALQRAAPYRHDIGLICDWLWGELERLGVDRRLDSHVDAQTVERLAPDSVIVATGSLPRRDGIQRMRPAHRVDGLGLPHVVTPLEVLDGSAGVPRRALVFDDLGNYQAVGSAEWLLEHGAEVVYSTSFVDLCPDLFRSFQRDAVAARLERYETFRLATRSSVQLITPSSAVIRSIDSGREETVEADLVVLVTGFEPQADLFDELQQMGIEARLAGDAIAPLLMPHAIRTGRAAGASV